MVGADVASMTHTARLSSTNTLVEVQLVESLAIVVVSGFAENLWLFMVNHKFSAKPEFMVNHTASNGKLGEGLYCKQREASWARE